MAKKEIVSIRFGSKPSERMMTEEWQNFRLLAGYFDISESALVESALRYAELAPVSAAEKYRFDEAVFDKMCGQISSLSVFAKSLAVGKLEKPVVINAEGLDLTLPKSAIIRYIPPYILSVEPSFQSRINIDLSERMEISEEEKRIFIKC